MGRDRPPVSVHKLAQLRLTRYLDVMVAMTLRLDEQMAFKLKLTALVERRPQSELIRQAIDEYLAQHGVDSIESLEATDPVT